MERRKFVQSLGFAATAALIGPKVFAGSNISENPVIAEGSVAPEFPALPYAYNALEPYIDARTMEIHYDKHHRAYYTNFVNAI